jgi:predicted nuclease of restriction endonuclease-like (RecB) superfamily
LSWTHYRIISRIENSDHRIQYIEHSIEGNWNTRTLQRNIDSQYLGRLLKFPEAENREISNYIKDPYIFEFLGLPSDLSQTETQIESALITHLQQFLMEWGKDLHL